MLRTIKEKIPKLSEFSVWKMKAKRKEVVQARGTQNE